MSLPSLSCDGCDGTRPNSKKALIHLVSLSLSGASHWLCSTLVGTEPLLAFVVAKMAAVRRSIGYASWLSSLASVVEVILKCLMKLSKWKKLKCSKNIFFAPNWDEINIFIALCIKENWNVASTAGTTTGSRILLLHPPNRDCADKMGAPIRIWIFWLHFPLIRTQTTAKSISLKHQLTCTKKGTMV